MTAGAAQAEPVTIAALGDSLTAGYGLSAETGFVSQLQAWLDAAGADVVVINAGVSGDTTAGGLSRAAWTLTPEVDAMIVALGANDYLRALDPVAARTNLAGILDAGVQADVDMLLIGMEVGSNYGPDYKAEFDAIFPELAEDYAIPLYPDWFTGLRDAVGDQASFTQYMQGDGLHPNAEGVSLIVEAMGPAILDLIARAER
ncbi:arylesterase [Cognatiyoonia sp.]|uniref:arylesterase n=1 Tax=Cognatiyoonia sp. TaxID=2211652 RepID=UPI003F6A41B8